MKNLISLHKREYGEEPEIIVSAPGSIKLMGEHTDYNEGYILQMAFNRFAEIAISRRKDNSLKFYSVDLNERKRTTIANLKYRREDRWANYPKGVLFLLAEAGYPYGGMNFSIHGDIPQNIGLASSAALITATIVAIRALFKITLSDNEAVELATNVEREFLGLETEPTDQLIAFVAKAGNIVFLDLRTLNYEHLPLKLNGVKLLLTNSNLPVISTEGELRERKREYQECLKFLSDKKSGKVLRDFNSSDLQQMMGTMPENLRRRCLHVIEENERVLEARNVLLRGNMAAFGKILNRSHESLRDNYEVSCPELDWLVKRAWEIDGVLGSRMSGFWYGGCTITLIRENAVGRYLEKLDEYERIFGFKAESFISEPADGVRIVYKKES